ncbi:MAG: FecR domain-containing protein [Deltaproteobacteria bacterium]|nr:FecR domain-containing protein [Deltaproteobacteria bacterium]
MRKHRGLKVLIWLALLALLGAAAAQAAVVGKFAEVEGSVDLLKGGKLPAAAVKVQDGVEVGDVVRTKSLGRAQIKFIDDTVMTIAPGSRIAIEEYMFDAAKGKRQAVVQVFQGMVKTAVGKVYEAEKPDFILKSHTAVMGVRGTTWYALLTPTATEVYTANSRLEVGNIFPEIPARVLMKSLQYVKVGFGLAPTVPVDITEDDLKLLDVRFSVKGAGEQTMGPESSTPQASLFTSTTEVTGQTVLSDPASLTSTQSAFVQNINSGLYVPPSAGAGLFTYTFSQTWEGPYQLTSQSPYTTGTYSSMGFNGFGQRTGVYPGHFTASFVLTANITTSGYFFSPSLQGTFWVTSCTGTVRGTAGGTLTGTMNLTAQTSGGTTFTLSGPVTLMANGTLTFLPSGTFGFNQGSGVVTVGNASGNWAQEPFNHATIRGYQMQPALYRIPDAMPEKKF